jgi:hypothetical protein
MPAVSIALLSLKYEYAAPQVVRRQSVKDGEVAAHRTTHQISAEEVPAVAQATSIGSRSSCGWDC